MVSADSGHDRSSDSWKRRHHTAPPGGIAPVGLGRPAPTGRLSDGPASTIVAGRTRLATVGGGSRDLTRGTSGRRPTGGPSQYLGRHSPLPGYHSGAFHWALWL